MRKLALVAPAALMAVATLAAPHGADGQLARGLALQVAQVEAGTVRFQYATKPDVEICEQGIRIGDHRMNWRSHGDDGGRNCSMGTAELELRVRDGIVREVEVLYRERDRTRGAVELGSVAPGQAAQFLLALARQDGASPGAAEDALFPATLADVDGLWRDLADVARDPGLLEGVRKNALFWLGQEAAQAATEGIARVALDEQEDQEIREAAIFALSQRPDEEGMPILMELARTAREAETRRSSMFWLAQSEDDRVIGFFEEILFARSR